MSLSSKPSQREEAKNRYPLDFRADIVLSTTTNMIYFTNYYALMSLVLLSCIKVKNSLTNLDMIFKIINMRKIITHLKILLRFVFINIVYIITLFKVKFPHCLSAE